MSFSFLRSQKLDPAPMLLGRNWHDYMMAEEDEKDDEKDEAPLPAKEPGRDLPEGRIPENTTLGQSDTSQPKTSAGASQPAVKPPLQPVVAAVPGAVSPKSAVPPSSAQSTAPQSSLPVAAAAAGQKPEVVSPPAAQSTTPQPQPVAAPPQRRTRGVGMVTSNARDVERARRNGAVIANGNTVKHSDGSLLYHDGFTSDTFHDDAEKGTTIPYRDDHGNKHDIPVQGIRRVKDDQGNMSYHFNVEGNQVSMAEGEKPLFQVDKDGKRFTQGADGTRRELGYDANVAAGVGASQRQKAAEVARQQKMAEGAALTSQLKQKQADAAAAQQRFTAAQKRADEVHKASTAWGPDAPVKPTWEQETAARQELMDAYFDHDKRTQELEAVQKQHDEHYRNFVINGRAREAEINHYQNAAAESPADAPWQKDARSMQGDTREADRKLMAEAEKHGPEAAAAMRQALVPPQQQQLFAAAKNSFGSGQPEGQAGGQPGQPAGAGAKSMSLQEMLMHAPEMTQGTGWRQQAVPQADAARATAQHVLGISDPENVRVTPGEGGTYHLSRPAADGSGADVPFATLDAQSGHMTLATGPDGRPTQAAQELAAQAPANGIPIHRAGAQQPMSAAERSDLIAKGEQATGSTADRRKADAALTQAGLSPEGIGQMVQDGRLSEQDGKLLNNKFNSGVTSYAERQAGEIAEKQDADLQKMQQDAKGTKGKPTFRSWLDKDDAQINAQVKAKAAELGVSEDAVRRDLETRRIADWTTPLSQASHDQQTSLGYGLVRKFGAVDRAEPTRTLPDGSIMPNPELGGDRAEFDQAIDGSLGTKEAKEKARGLWDKYHDNYLSNVRPSLETMPKIPGVENYIAWRERMQKEGAFNHLSENQKAERYMEEQKKRSGFVQFIDNLGSNLLAGSHDLVAGIAGTAGLLTGSKAASEFAAEKAEQAERTTAALQHTGNDGLVNNVIGGGARAVPGMVAAAATGGALGTASKAVGLLGNGTRVTQVANALNTAANSAKVARVVNAATAFTQTAGTTYADLYKHHRELGLSHEAASQKAAGASMVSGAVSAALGGISLGGAQALSNPATREVAKKSFGEAMKTFLKGSGKEMTQEALDSGVNTIASEMNKGKTLKAAVATAFEQLPETLTTAGVMGGGVETAAHLIHGTQWDHHDSASAAAPPAPAPGGQGEAGGQPQAASAGSQQGIPQTATPSEPGTAPPAKIPVPTFDEAIAARQTAEKLKAQKGPLSADQRQALDAAEKTFARKVEDNILQHQAQIEKRGGKLHPTAAKALANARAALARRAPQGAADAAVEGGTGNSGQPSPTTVNNAPSEAALQRPDGRPSQTSSAPVPTLDEAVAARQTAEKLRAQKGPLSPEQQQAQDAAEKTYARKVEDNILMQQAGIEKRGGKLHPTAAKALADARAVLARPGPGGGPDGSVNADNTTTYHSNGTDANTTDGIVPGQAQEGRQARLASPGQPPSTTANKGQPRSTLPSALSPTRTPPLSLEQSRRLIENVAQMRPEARQHPQVQADLAQARAVVNAESQNKTEAGASEEAPPNVREPEAQGAIPPPGNLPPKPIWLPTHLVAAWDEKLAAARVRDPADHTEILEHLENLGPLDRLQVYRAVQSFLDLIPGDITRSLTRFHMRGESATSIKEKVGHEAQGAWSPSRVDKEHRGHGVFQEVTVPATILVSHDLNGDETALRTTVWHEMTHWLWDEAGRADAPPRLAQWRRDLEQHFHDRTANEQPEPHQKGYWFLRDHWIHSYSGKISNTEPTAQLLANPPAIELATTYMEKFARGGLGPARWSDVKGADSTFNIVMNILGDKK